MIPDNMAVIAIMLLVAFAMSACSSNTLMEQKAYNQKVQVQVYKDRSQK